MHVAVPIVSVAVSETFKVLPFNVSVPPVTVTAVVTPASLMVAGHEYWSTVAVLPLIEPFAVAPQADCHVIELPDCTMPNVNAVGVGGTDEPSEHEPENETEPVHVPVHSPPLLQAAITDTNKTIEPSLRIMRYPTPSC